MAEIHFTPKDILQKDFKQKIRGYDPTDVDSFLDMVIRDYETFNKMTQQLQNENDHLRNKVDELSARVSSQNPNTPLTPPDGNGSQSDQDREPLRLDNTTYMDILKRLSNLENRVFGSHANNHSHRL